MSKLLKDIYNLYFISETKLSVSMVSSILQQWYKIGVQLGITNYKNFMLDFA
jgi:hypothetical protein